MATEEQLLSLIFDDSAAAGEREAAIAALKRITGKDRAGLVEKYTRGSPVSREIEIITLKSELSTIDRHMRVLMPSVLAGHDELYDELYLHTRIGISSLTTTLDLIRALRYLVDEAT
jgi:hypothetical protein